MKEPGPPSTVPTIDIRPSSTRLPRLEARELWRYRELALFLALRDLKLRYRQTFFGAAWAVLQPLLAAGVFTLLLGRVDGLPTDGLPYSVFVFSGLVLWIYFSGAVDAAAQSLVEDRSLVERVYFPRLLAPLAAVGPGLVDLVVSLLILGVFMAVAGIAPPTAIVLAPLAVLATMVFAAGAGLWLCALNVRYRDVRHALPFALQLWFFASPVVVASSVLDGAARYVYALNPMVGAIDLFRFSVVGAPAPGPPALVSLGAGVVLTVTGVLYFRFREREFADVI